MLLVDRISTTWRFNYTPTKAILDLWAKLTVALQSFGADRFFALGIAREIATAEGNFVFVTGDQHEYPGMRYILSGQPGSQFIQIFDDGKSVIFPAGESDRQLPIHQYTASSPYLARVLRPVVDPGRWDRTVRPTHHVASPLGSSASIRASMAGAGALWRSDRYRRVRPTEGRPGRRGDCRTMVLANYL